MAEDKNILHIDYEVDLSFIKKREDLESIKNEVVQKVTDEIMSQGAQGRWGGGGKCSHSKHSKTTCSGSANG